MSPLVSIIIPTYNRAHLISETLDSIVAQTYTNWECIIVDDDSTDNTVEIINKYIKNESRFQYHLRPKGRQKGPNSCRNFGYELSKGKFINWFDSDDIMLSCFLEKQICSISKQADMSVCKLVYFDFDKEIITKESTIVSNNLIEDYLLGKIQFYVSPPMWNKVFLIKQVELFDETLTNLDDWDFNLRMLYQAPKIALVDEVLIKYRIHASSLSQEINKLNFEEIKSEFRAREKHLKLIKGNKNVNLFVVQTYIKDRYKYILRDVMVQGNVQRRYFLKKLLFSQVKLFDFAGILKTLFSFIIFSIFRKGYKFLN
ncbi:glycosyltransferase family 2 protein [Flavobacterium soyangense]|uniref:Glycosyltransferase n=1 Tax=Flavobacterium soyangense TaxID=2023265 RepID=A0A930U9Y5_9FLAO|nr:glycosyltransferase [Flavobacterium soyangense]MBF2708232.1 glycosyltransferase [Flavobacterium soyangense]